MNHLIHPEIKAYFEGHGWVVDENETMADGVIHNTNVGNIWYISHIIAYLKSDRNVKSDRKMTGYIAVRRSKKEPLTYIFYNQPYTEEEMLSAIKLTSFI